MVKSFDLTEVTNLFAYDLNTVDFYERVVLFKGETTESLSLCANFPYEFWCDGEFLGSGGQRCSLGELIVDHWNLTSTTASTATLKTRKTVIVRMHLFGRESRHLTLRTIFESVVFAHLPGSAAIDWSWTFDSTLEFLAPVNGNLPRQTRNVGDFRRLENYQELTPTKTIFESTGVAWRAIEAPGQLRFQLTEAILVESLRIQIEEAEDSVTRLFTSDNPFGEALQVYRENQARIRNDLPATANEVFHWTYDLQAIALYRFELECDSAISLVFSEVASVAEIEKSRERARLADVVVAARQSVALNGLRGCRYVHVFSCSSASIKLYCQRQIYDYEFHFQLRNKQFVDVAKACQRTLSACSDGGLIDSCWRERAQWTGDLRMSAKAVRALTRDRTLVNHCLRQIAHSYNEKTGMVAGLWPAYHPGYPCLDMPTWHLAFVLSAFENDCRDPFVLQVVQRSLEFWLENYLKSGLIVEVPGWTFIDWSPQRDLQNFDGGPVRAYAIVNAWFEMACRFAGISGISKLAFVEAFWLEPHQAWRAILPKNPSEFSEPSIHASAVILASLPGTAGLQWLVEQWPVIPKLSAYFCYFVAKAYTKHSEALTTKYLLECYQPMSEKIGTLFEKTSDTDSRAHGWSIGIAELLVKSNSPAV